MSRTRLLAFAAVCVLAAGISAGALVYGGRRAADRGAAAAGAEPLLDVAAVLAGPHIVFRSTADGPTYGKLALVPLSRPAGPRAVVGLACARVYATRSAGLCLSDDGGLQGASRAVLLDSRLTPGRKIPVSGVPSRTRVSPDGRLAATTTFVEGHSYAEGGFSTATTLYDLRSARPLGNLEDFPVVHDGRRYRAPDINLWGVTFAGGDRFYATVASRGRIWLAEGDLARRELRTLRDGIECPALSPDGRRLAYKQRVGAEVGNWRLHVLDLRTGRDVALADTRSVDDQAEWLDDEQVVYGRARQRGDGTYVGDETDVWVVPADGSGQPRVLVPGAWSPAVVRATAG